MNAVVALCHFCEAHGPNVVICTGTEPAVSAERDVSDDAGSSVVAPPCPACAPTGIPPLLQSSIRGGCTYYTRKAPSDNETDSLLRHACVRSISCEVSPMQENSIVFFSDPIRGHVLSYAFQVQDSKARGLKRSFSFIVLMKDKMFLLNIAPFLIKQMEEIATELQTLANEVFTNDQAICSQRALRLKTNKMPNEYPRSLVQLTGKEHVYIYLHTAFSCMLNASTRIFSEEVCGKLSSVMDSSKVPTSSDVQNENKSDAQDKSDESIMCVVFLKDYIGRDNLINILYCIFVGIQVVIRGDSKLCEEIVSALATHLPREPKSIEYSDYVPSSESRLFYCKSDVAVPKPCNGIFRIDIVDQKPIVHWTGQVPTKWPTLLTMYMKAIDENMRDKTLLYHTRALRLRWINNAFVLNCFSGVSASAESIQEAKNTMSIKPEDEELLDYWMLT